MLTVVGGAYREICLRPQWDQFFGSGVRAATAVSKLVGSASKSRCVLHSWRSRAEADQLLGLAASFGFDVEAHQRHQPIEFQYDHAMGPPRLFPERSDIQKVPTEAIEAENALCFSLIEGDFHLRAKGIVYDPQAGRRAISLKASGHSAQKKGIVANLSEVRAMLATGNANLSVGDHLPTSLGQALLRQEEVSVVVVKNGVEGATVVTEGGTARIPSFVSEAVFPIGSGDVFSAVFAYYWLEEGKASDEAALLASAATARYCSSRALPIPMDLPAQIGGMRKGSTVIVPSRSRQVYLAGPLFTLSQLWLLNEAKLD